MRQGAVNLGPMESFCGTLVSVALPAGDAKTAVAFAATGEPLGVALPEEHP